MFIEFIGMVGAGKTTIAQSLQSLLRDRGYTVLSRGEAVFICLERSFVGRLVHKLVPTAVWRRRILRAFYIGGPRFWNQLYFVLTQPKLTWQIYQSQFRRDIPWWHRRIILNLFFRMAGTYFYLRHRLRPEEIVLLEEGFLHRAVNLYAWEVKELEVGILRSYFSALPVLDLVIFIQTPISVCLERSQMRGHPSRVELQDPKVLERFMAQASRIIQMAADFLANDSREVITIDNSQELDLSTVNLQTDLDTYLAGMVHRPQRAMAV